ncbi:phosphoribosylformylglycinamidine cyclo-ligase [Clostridium amylolyticum]|uniref:Phosphoribosylformylglycinamidine cyclo-ligase n=1 Tax=Clostridium amylolyticum TaxID=1121298 RepID=A0A1M6IN72_9CLOT|nr:phosphoribosylformylglycinamidine cyclo-ligase [Clostridium amylolyticum]SHJ35895.1 phosphoribosylformylglycinamidine cyclo-ligase [Clostridium amylolyticum]
MITYKEAGVNIEEGYKAVSLMKEYAAKTTGNLVLNSLGSFAAMIELPEGYKKPVLVTGTDGVGTKLDIAFKTKKYDTVGIDCVAMCVNDILCHGAKPLFFLDYIACGKLEAQVAADLVKGVSEGCTQCNASLVGGETAEMPGFYREGEYDIAGFAVGIVDKDKIVDGKDIKEEDALIGLSSSGFHSNGYSLIRKVFTDIDEIYNGQKLGEVLLTPTKVYVKPILNVLEKFNVKGMAHITGGGFIENIPRMLPKGLTAVINKNSYPIPEIYERFLSLGITEDELFNTFNMGIGFVLCVDKSIKEQVIKYLISLGERAYDIGFITSGDERICIK